MTTLLAAPLLFRVLSSKTAVAGLKIALLNEITLAFEFLVLSLTVLGLRSKIS